jgi:hypothetical protein
MSVGLLAEQTYLAPYRYGHEQMPPRDAGCRGNECIVVVTPVESARSSSLRCPARFSTLTPCLALVCSTSSDPGTVRIPDELAILNAAIAYSKANGRTYSMAQAYSLHPDGTLAAHTVTSTRAYTEIDGLDDGRSLFAIVSFEGVINFTAEGRLYYRVGAHLNWQFRNLRAG